MTTTIRSANARPLPSRRAVLATLGSAASLAGIGAAVGIPAARATDTDRIAELIGRDDPRAELVRIVGLLDDEDAALVLALARRYRREG